MNRPILYLGLAIVMAPMFSAAPASAGLFDVFKRNPEVEVPAPTPPAAVQGGGQGMAPAAVQVQSTPGEAQAALRMDRMEQQLRALTGQVEELHFRVRQLQEQLRSQPGGARRSSAPAPVPAPRAVAAVPAAADPIGQTIGAAPGDPMDADGPGAAPRDLGQLPADAGTQPLDLSNLGSTGGAPTQAPAPSGSARGDYDAAYDLVLKGDYQVAETAFRRFVSSYPADPLAADAQYWIGESLFAQQEYRGSADAFLAGYKQYPKSGKAPDMLLKLGLSLAGLGQREAACGTYAEILKNYPKSSNALLQRVKAEQASASC